MATVAELAAEAESTSDSSRLADLATHKSVQVRIAVAGNPRTSDATLKLLISDHSVGNWAAAHLADRPDLQPFAASSPDRHIRATVAATYQDDDQRALPRRVQAQLARDESRDVRRVIAFTTQYRSIFESLLTDPDATVRGCCAGNPRISEQQIDILLHDRIARTRSIAVAMGLRYPTDIQLVELARDRSVEVHWQIICRVDAPLDALRIIASLPDEMNRQHAQLILDGGYVNAPQAQAETRLERQRAFRGLTFVD